jgi:hypothetical protein
MAINIPVVGSDVEVIVANHFGAAQIPSGPKTRTYTGRVVAPYKWLDDRQFCMTGNAEWPTRVIHTNNIVKLRIIKGKAKKINTDIEIFTVKGSKGNSYTVTKSSNGWTCTCTGFEFRRSCKHVAELGKKVK